MKKKKILAFGAFDLLHPGHRFFLKEAKKLGDYLTVVVARDNNIRRFKKITPDYSEKQRLKMIKSLGIANRVILGQKDLKKKYDVINKLKPDIVALGYDQKIFIKNLPEIIEKMNMSCRVVRLKAYRPEKYKSSIYRLSKKK